MYNLQEILREGDLVIIADSMEECVHRLLVWKEGIQKKGLRVNMGKSKIMIGGTNLDILQSLGRVPLWLNSFMQYFQIHVYSCKS